VAGAQQLEEVETALGAGRAKPGEVGVANLGAEAVGGLVACAGVVHVLVAGEIGTVLIVGADIGQAVIVLDRIEAKLRVSPVLRQLIKSRTQFLLRLTNGILVQVKAPLLDDDPRGERIIVFRG